MALSQVSLYEPFAGHAGPQGGSEWTWAEQGQVGMRAVDRPLPSARKSVSSSAKRLAGCRAPGLAVLVSLGPWQEAVLLPKVKTSFLSQLVVF